MTRPSDKKTDNFNLPLKLELRRKLLVPFAARFPLRVVDCCSGQRAIWSALGKEFALAQYTAMDRKRLSVGLRVDSVRWLNEVGVTGNVIDIDTYGEPWGHYLAVCHRPWPSREILVFLTLGKGLGNMGRISNLAIEAAGLKREWQGLIPPASNGLRQIVIDSLLTRGYDNDTIIQEGWECRPPGSEVRYFGLRLLRRNGDDGKGAVRTEPAKPAG